MAYLFANGYKGSKMQVRDNGALLEEFIFPMYYKDGFKESHLGESITKKTIGRNYKNKRFGEHLQWTLDYSKNLELNNLMKFKKIIKYWEDKDLSVYTKLELWFFRRVDVLADYYSVYPSIDNIDVALNRGGEFSPGNSLIVIQFSTLNMLKGLNISDPNDRNYGFVIA